MLRGRKVAEALPTAEAEAVVRDEAIAQRERERERVSDSL